MAIVAVERAHNDSRRSGRGEPRQDGRDDGEDREDKRRQRQHDEGNEDAEEPDAPLRRTRHAASFRYLQSYAGTAHTCVPFPSARGTVSATVRSVRDLSRAKSCTEWDDVRASFDIADARWRS
jgi:hypothetical protein